MTWLKDLLIAMGTKVEDQELLLIALNGLAPIGCLLSEAFVLM